LKSFFLQAGMVSLPAMDRIADGKIIEMWHVQNTPDCCNSSAPWRQRRQK
jgi:hypothetical protein